MSGVAVTVYIDNADFSAEGLSVLMDASPTPSSSSRAGRERCSATAARCAWRGSTGIPDWSCWPGSWAALSRRRPSGTPRPRCGRPRPDAHCCCCAPRPSPVSTRLTRRAEGAAAPGEVADLLPLLFDRLDGEPLRALYLLATFRDAVLDPVHVGALSAAPDAAALCARFAELGLAERTEAGYRVVPDVVPALLERGLAPFDLDRFSDHFTEWIARPATTAAQSPNTRGRWNESPNWPSRRAARTRGTYRPGRFARAGPLPALRRLGPPSRSRASGRPARGRPTGRGVLHPRAGHPQAAHRQPGHRGRPPRRPPSCGGNSVTCTERMPRRVPSSTRPAVGGHASRDAPHGRRCDTEPVPGRNTRPDLGSRCRDACRSGFGSRCRDSGGSGFGGPQCRDACRPGLGPRRRDACRPRYGGAQCRDARRSDYRRTRRRDARRSRHRRAQRGRSPRRRRIARSGCRAWGRGPLVGRPAPGSHGGHRHRRSGRRGSGRNVRRRRHGAQGGRGRRRRRHRWSRRRAVADSGAPPSRRPPAPVSPGCGRTAAGRRTSSRRRAPGPTR
ncbi:hypothetical protein NKH77_31970 [Streptomyces sp. M19]